jgi:hypothetical protein
MRPILTALENGVIDVDAIDAVKQQEEADKCKLRGLVRRV